MFPRGSFLIYQTKARGALLSHGVAAAVNEVSYVHSSAESLGHCKILNYILGMQKRCKTTFITGFTFWKKNKKQNCLYTN